MKYNEISYIEKLEQLQSAFTYSTKFSEVIGVSRRTLLNWKHNPESISAKNRLDIDVLYCKHFIISQWDNPKQTFEPIFLPDNMPHNEATFLPFLRRLSFGTIEIETNMAKTDFDLIIDESKFPKSIDRKTFHEGFNTFMTHKQLWQRIVEHGEEMSITVETIRSLHTDLMRGIHEQAGFFSTKIRIMGQLEGVRTTDPTDIEEEIHRWVYKEAKAKTLQAIAKAHVYFILVHPFGDGNGRVGRALVMMQCLNARLMPPVFDGENKAMYYAAMEYAIKHGRYAPLNRLFHEAAIL